MWRFFESFMWILWQVKIGSHKTIFRFHLLRSHNVLHSLATGQRWRPACFWQSQSLPTGQGVHIKIIWVAGVVTKVTFNTKFPWNIILSQGWHWDLSRPPDNLEAIGSSQDESSSKPLPECRDSEVKSFTWSSIGSFLCIIKIVQNIPVHHVFNHQALPWTSYWGCGPAGGMLWILILW